jgi:hypothetical protein
MSESVDREVASGFVAALSGSARERSLVEVRFRSEPGMGQRFFSVERPRAVVDAVLSLAVRTDVFVGVLPRVRARGRLQDVVEWSGVIWADCRVGSRAGVVLAETVDDRGFGERSAPARALVSAEPIELASVESLNWRLAVALGADTES